MLFRSAFDLVGWARLLGLLNRGFTRVYDLQTSDRSSFYRNLMGFPFSRPPEWSGIAAGSSHPHANPARDFQHTVERQREQLLVAGIKEVPLPDLSWAKADVRRFNLKAPYVLLVPGGSAHRPEKRWPPGRFGALARRLVAAGVTPVLIGTKSEAGLLKSIAASAVGTKNRSEEHTSELQSH